MGKAHQTEAEKNGITGSEQTPVQVGPAREGSEQS